MQGIADALEKCMQEWSWDGIVFAIVTDNASSMNKAGLGLLRKDTCIGLVMPCSCVLF